MAGAKVALAASVNPGQWTKDVSAEENLKSFTRYMLTFKRWMDICDMNGYSDKQKWSLFIATGGTDLEDLVIHQAKVETRGVPEVVTVPAAPGVAEIAGTPALQDCHHALHK